LKNDAWCVVQINLMQNVLVLDNNLKSSDYTRKVLVIIYQNNNTKDSHQT